MTSFPKNLMVAAAACAITAGSAVAQSYEAEIPFTFRAGRVRMAPGRYQIWIESAARMIRFHNEDSRETLLLPASTGAGGSDTGALKLRFRCGGGRCSLASLRVGGSEGAYTFRMPPPGRDDAASVAEISLKPLKGE
jgi:hypothetical protein